MVNVEHPTTVSIKPTNYQTFHTKCIHNFGKALYFPIPIEEKINSGNSCVIDPSRFRAADIFDAWHNNDTIVSELLKYQARALGIGIANVINITGVERIIVGGTIYHELESDLMPIVKENADKYSIGNGLDGVKILLNDLGDEAPALGASMLD